MVVSSTLMSMVWWCFLL